MSGKLPAESSIPENTTINHTFSPFRNTRKTNPVFSQRTVWSWHVYSPHPGKLAAGREGWHRVSGRCAPPSRVPALAPPMVPFSACDPSSPFLKGKSKRPQCKPATCCEKSENCKTALGFEACVSLWFTPRWVHQARLREITGFSCLE